jgi:D-sedoheptulose 7-phosphate isomerase|tara:strand:- start:3612 stop:4181 length:570 start_codon:yes stop_codon:yes gene_type:complete
MSDKDFVKTYLEDFSTLVRPDDQIVEKIISARNTLVQVKKNNSKIMIFGNGGSAAIASHFSVDLTKNAKVRCVNFNESDLITCFSNDYGYEKWVEKAIDFYADKRDALILISSSGKSPNMINACKAARNKQMSTVITFTGHEKDNPLSKLGDINFWINSKAYNFVENVHQVWLLTIVDLIIGKREYLPN